jgi:hypothetical protein
VEPKTIERGHGELQLYARTTLRAIRKRHPNMPAPFGIDRAESTRWRDRALRALVNPLTDVFVDLALPRAPWALHRQLLNYKVLRMVFRGYREGAA